MFDIFLYILFLLGEVLIGTKRQVFFPKTIIGKKSLTYIVVVSRCAVILS